MSASVHVSARHARLSTPRSPRAWARLGRWLLRLALIALSLVSTLALGLATQVVDGALASWVARDASAAVYASAWCFGLALLRPGARPRTLAALAFAVCLGIEASQLWHPHWLEVARATHLGRLALGSTFMWTDLAYSAVGAGIAGLWLRILPGRSGEPRHERLDFVRPMGVRP